MRTLLFVGFVIVFICHAEADINDSIDTKQLDRWAFRALNLPRAKVSGVGQVVVAVVDDGFRLSHNSLREFLFFNENEIPGNHIDDDNNGYIDDYRGWDVSDNDADVSIPADKHSSLYHGTFIASLVTQITGWSVLQPEEIKILPVKVMSDYSASPGIKDGYDGIEYAIKMGADIICCAWSGGTTKSAEHQIIQQALKDNVLIIGAAGNMYMENVDPPASNKGVLAVAALDTLLRKTIGSNYGMEIDLSLPGTKVRAAYPLADNAWFYGEGTSAAAGLATGCAAVLKCLKPEAPSWEITEALKNTAMPLDSINFRYSGKLGSGLPDLTRAADYLLNPDKRQEYFDSKRPEGTIYLGRKQQTQALIHPNGGYASVMIFPDKTDSRDLKKKIAVYSGDSLFYEGTVQEAQQGITIPGNQATIGPLTQKMKDFPSALKLNYYVNTIDSTRLYCNGKVTLQTSSGEITDGSGENNYTNNSSCQWLIKVPEKKRILFNFTAFDTEANVDYVWLFDGNSPLQENIIAKFSGNEIPPVVTSRTNTVCIWFVTDSRVTRKGWELKFEGVE